MFEGTIFDLITDVRDGLGGEIKPMKITENRVHIGSLAEVMILKGIASTVENLSDDEIESIAKRTHTHQFECKAEPTLNRCLAFAAKNLCEIKENPSRDKNVQESAAALYRVLHARFSVDVP